MTDESVQHIPANKLKAGWELLQLTFEEWTNDNAFELSAPLAFYTIFSIAPVLLIAVGVAWLLGNAGRIDLLATLRGWWPLTLVLWGVLELVAYFLARDARRSPR